MVRTNLTAALQKFCLNLRVRTLRKIFQTTSAVFQADSSKRSTRQPAHKMEMNPECSLLYVSLKRYNYFKQSAIHTLLSMLFFSMYLSLPCLKAVLHNPVRVPNRSTVTKARCQYEFLDLNDFIPAMYVTSDMYKAGQKYRNQGNLHQHGTTE